MPFLSVRNKSATPKIDFLRDDDRTYEIGTGFSKREEAALRIYALSIQSSLNEGSKNNDDSALNLPIHAKFAIVAADIFFDELERPAREQQEQAELDAAREAAELDAKDKEMQRKRDAGEITRDEYEDWWRNNCADY